MTDPLRRGITKDKELAEAMLQLSSSLPQPLLSPLLPPTSFPLCSDNVPCGNARSSVSISGTVAAVVTDDGYRPVAARTAPGGGARGGATVAGPVADSSRRRLG